jgi:acetolactate decarboxylase
LGRDVGKAPLDRRGTAGVLEREGDMSQKFLNRRKFLNLGARGCATCAALALGLHRSARAAAPTEIDGKGYALRFIGSQREAMMLGRRESVLDLRMLKGRPHLYGIGPLEWLGGEATIADARPSIAQVDSDQHIHVTETYDAGVAFFVWAEVPSWDLAPVPAEIANLRQLEAFVGDAGRQKGLTQAFPFVLIGAAQSATFHVGNGKPDTPPGMEAVFKTAVSSSLRNLSATYVGFWSNQHRGIFTHMDQDIHVHLQASDNTISGHVDALESGGKLQLALPKTSSNVI